MLTALYQGSPNGALVAGIDLLEWTKNTVPFKIENSASIGYVNIGSDDIKTGTNSPGIAKPDVSPIELWNRYGRNLGYDYIYVNDRIKELATSTDLSTYTDEEKDIILEKHILDVAILEQEFTLETVVIVGLAHRLLARAARSKRLDVASMYLQASIGDEPARLLGKPLIGILSLYTQQGDTEIIDYLDSTNNFVGNGFLESGVTSIVNGITLTTIRDELRSLLINGTKTDGTLLVSLTI